jgi:hypothetical protein
MKKSQKRIAINEAKKAARTKQADEFMELLKAGVIYCLKHHPEVGLYGPPSEPPILCGCPLENYYLPWSGQSLNGRELSPELIALAIQRRRTERGGRLHIPCAQTQNLSEEEARQQLNERRVLETLELLGFK